MSNKSKVRLHMPTRPAGTAYPRLAHPVRTPGFCCHSLVDHFQGPRGGAARPQAALALPRARVRRGLQGHAADIQVRRAAVVQRHPVPELQGQLLECVRRAEGQDDDAGDRGQVSRVVRLLPVLQVLMPLLREV